MPDLVESAARSHLCWLDVCQVIQVLDGLS